MSEEEKALRLYELAKQKGDTALQKKALNKVKEIRSVSKDITEEVSTVDLGNVLGKTARYGLEGAAGVADVLTGPAKAALNLVPGLNYGPTDYTQAATNLADRMGLSAPETPAEEVVGQASRFVAGGAPFIKGAQMASQAPGLIGNVAQVMATKPLLQGASMASAGAGGETARQSGAGPGGQFAAALGAGLLPGAIYGATSGAKTLLPVNQSTKQVMSKLDLSGLSKTAVKRIESKVDAALKQGDLDSTALKRMIDFERIQATPTTASVTLDPVTKTQQKNLAKIGAQSSNPNLQRLSRIEHDNNRAMVQALDDLAGGAEYDPYLGGQAAMRPIANKQQGLIQEQQSLYAQARDSAGRALPLDRAGFINRVDDLLTTENKTAFLPREFKTVLNQISKGQIKVGQETREVPFNVNTIDQLKTMLSTAQRSADGNTSRALSLVRQALDETQLQGGASDDAIMAFDKARAATASLKNWEESAPAIKAVVDGATPDQFMDKYVLPKSASVKDVAKLVDEVKTDPKAFDALKMQVAAWIKDRAIPTRVEGEGVLRSSSLNNALKKIGDRKLKLFFSDGEIETMKATNRVAFYEQYQPAGSAINNSNTATTLGGGLLNFIADRSPAARTTQAAFSAIDSAFNNAGRARQALNPTLLVPRPPMPKGALAIPLSMGLLPQQ